MSQNYEAKVEEMLADRVGSADEKLSSVQAASLFETIGRDLISVECGNVDAIAEAVGAVLTRVLLGINIPVIAEHIEVQIEAFAVRWVVEEIKAYGHARCVNHEG